MRRRGSILLPRRAGEPDVTDKQASVIQLIAKVTAQPADDVKPESEG